MRIIELLIIITLTLITYQDITQRAVIWFLFPLVAVLGGFFYLANTSIISTALIFISINLSIIFFILLIVWFYSHFKLKKELNTTLGNGDIFLLIGLAFCFPVDTFIITLTSSLILSLILHLLFTKKSTVPLAGFMSIYYSIFYSAFFLGWNPKIFN